MINTTRIMRYIAIAFVLFFVLTIIFINKNLASAAEMLLPGSFLWVHLVLLGIEGGAFFLFWRGLFGRQKHLILLDDDSPEGRDLLQKELVSRLKANPLIQNIGLAPSGPDDAETIEKCLTLLTQKANDEIEQSSRKIFLATALAQNGRIDAIVVFFSLCRMIWRISSIYNQRPHPREVASLYWTVISTTFLALSLEELDITTEITVGFSRAFHAVAPAGMTASIPFAGKALQVFTNATIDGAANCYLALRAGIIARNAYAFAFAEKRPSRAAVYREAGGILLTISASIMDKLAGGLADVLTGAVKNAHSKTFSAGKGIVRSLGSGLGFRHKEE